MSDINKALILPKHGAEFTLSTVKKYKPAHGEILIKVHSAALNPADWKIQKYGVFLDRYGPDAVLGFDIAGEVEEVGEGVTGFSKGDRVISPCILKSETGGFQQYALAPVSTVAKIPSNVSFDEAASIPSAINVVWSGLYANLPNGAAFQAPVTPETIGKYAGVPIVILGGSSSVGQLAIQSARISGFSPIITTSSIKHQEFLQSLGATHVVSRSLSDDEIISSVVSIVEGKEVKIVYDAISSEETAILGSKLLAKGGKLVLVLFNVLKAEVTENKGITLIEARAFVDAPYNLELFRTLYHGALPEFLVSGQIKPNRVEILPNGLTGIPDGLRRMESDQVSGVKLIARPWETA